MNIGELAHLTDTSVRSIRHYEARGLLKSERGCNGYRQFGPDAIVQVRQIRRMVRLGFSLEEIATFPSCMLNGPSEALCPVAMAAHEEKLLNIERQIEALEKQRARLVDTLRNAESGHT